MTFPFSENTLIDLGFVSKYFGLTQQETSRIKEIDYKYNVALNRINTVCLSEYCDLLLFYFARNVKRIIDYSICLQFETHNFCFVKEFYLSFESCKMSVILFGSMLPNLGSMLPNLKGH